MYDGILHLHDLAGRALANAQAENDALREQIAQLEQANSNLAAELEAARAKPHRTRTTTT